MSAAVASSPRIREQARPAPARVKVGAAGAPIRVNGRFRVHENTGLQRYANELIGRLGSRLEVLEPARPLKGLKGHAWEQFVLPVRVGSRVLWSPCNTGPCWVKRQVVTIHDVFPLDNPEWFSKSFVAGFSRIVPRLLRTAERVITVSEFTKQRVMALTGADPTKISVIPCGISSRFAPADAETILGARSAVGLTGGRYLLSVSSIEPRKNVARVLRAWADALPQLPADLHLVMAGRSVSSSVFASIDLDHCPDRVIFPGYVAEEHLPGLYSGATGFVFPSLAEGFGLPPVEAMACGVPVLTSDRGALKEVTDGAALLVDPLNTGAIAAAMLQLAADTYTQESLRERGLTRARRFNWDDAATRTWGILESVVHGRS